MLIRAQMGEYLWVEAMIFAAYIKKRIPRAGYDKSPYELCAQLWGWPVEMRLRYLKHIRTFGCLAYVHIPKDNPRRIQSQKSAPRAVCERLLDTLVIMVESTRSTSPNQAESSKLETSSLTKPDINNYHQ